MGEPASAIIVAFRIPGSVEAIRRDHVRVARLGVPPHVTILSPFVGAAELGPEVRRRLAGIAATVPAFDVRFGSVDRVPDALYLPPIPAGPFIRLASAVVEAFPGLHPYGDPGLRAEDVVPHLTIAIGDGNGFEELAARAGAALPMDGRATALTVVAARDDGRWRTVWRIPLRR